MVVNGSLASHVGYFVSCRVVSSKTDGCRYCEAALEGQRPAQISVEAAETKDGIRK